MPGTMVNEALREEESLPVRELVSNEHISDRIIGFHAQQAVEKYTEKLVDDVAAWAVEQLRVADVKERCPAATT